MPRLEPTNDSYIREIVRDELAEVTPRFGIIQEVHSYMGEEETTNYKVDVQITETGEEAGVTHTYVPVTAAMTGAARGLTVGDLALVEYRRGNSDLPIVTDVLYDDSDAENAPMVDENDFRLQIGEDAVIEVVTDTESGNRRINIGKQTTDHDGIDAGLSINIDDGSFSLMNEEEHGLFVDSEGNSIQRWESYASPWGAAGDVNWDDSAGAGVETSTLDVSVEDADGNPVEGASVTIEQTDTQSTLSVSVEDADGNPIEGAAVSITEDTNE